MKSNDAYVVLEGLLNLLKEKKATNDEKKLKKAKKAEEERTKKGEEERIKKAEEDGTNK